MRITKVIVLALVCLTAGYVWGFGEGSQGQKNVAVRVLNSFGVAKIKAAEEARQARTEEAARP